jgi:hypothetical protein
LGDAADGQLLRFPAQPLVYAAHTTRERTWEVVAALFIAGWIASFLGRTLLLAIPAEVSRVTSLLATVFVVTVLEAVALRYVLPRVAQLELSFLDACAVAVVGQLPLVLLVAARGTPGFAPAISVFSLTLSVGTLYLQYIVLRAIIGSTTAPVREPVIEALARTPEPEYASVLGGIRETTAAVEQAFMSVSAPGNTVLDELAALAAHERRLRKLGSPDRRVHQAHDALLAELAAYQDQLIDSRDEPRAHLESGERIRALISELAAYA